MVKFANIRIVLAATLLAGTVATLSACGGEGNAGQPATATTPTDAEATTPTNTATTQALALTGSPRTSAVAGQAYLFIPSARGSTATYSITNKPAWAQFNVATGALSGKPADTHVGTYAGIVISASDGAALPAFSINVTSAGSGVGAATLSWQPPTQNTDGSTVTKLAGYRIYHGTDPANLSSTIQVSNAGLTAYTVANLGSGTHYFGISAFTLDGHESDMSSIGSMTIM